MWKGVSMETINQKLDNFYNSDENVFLLTGDWGVGKTFVVDSWLKQFEYEKEVKVIRLSLYGVSYVYELESQLLGSIYYINKFAKITNDVECNISYELAGATNVNFSMKGLFSIFARKVYKENKKRKYIIVIDDIERKDCNLSLNHIFGFIDSLKLKNTKVILIANCEILCKDSSYKFKEKVVDIESKLIKPTKEAIESIVPNELIDILCLDKINNLRILKKFFNIYKQLPKKDNLDKATLNIILSIFIQNNSNIYSKELYIKNKINLETDVRKKIELSKNQIINEEDIAKQVNDKYNNYGNSKILYEFIKDSTIYSRITNKELENGICKICNLVETEHYEEAFNFKFEYIDRERNKILNKSTSDIFYSSNPKKLIKLKFEVILSTLQNDVYDYFEVYEFFQNVLSYHCEEIYYDETNNFLKEEIINKLSIFLAKQLYETRNYYSNQMREDLLIRPENYALMKEDVCLLVSKTKDELINIFKCDISKKMNESFCVEYVLETLNKINIIMLDMNYKIDIDVKKEIYFNLIDKSITLLSKDITNTWSNIHKLFKMISADCEIDKNDIIELINQKVDDKDCIQKYRLKYLTGKYINLK